MQPTQTPALRLMRRADSSWLRRFLLPPRERMAIVLGVSRDDTDDALEGLLDADLVVMRPWRAGGRDGVWQLLQPSPRQEAPRTGTALTAADVLRSLGFPSS